MPTKWRKIIQYTFTRWSASCILEGTATIERLRTETRLRKVRREAPTRHSYLCQNVKELIGCAGFVELLKDHGEIAFDVLKVKPRAEELLFRVNSHKYQLPLCSKCAKSSHLLITQGWDPADCGDSIFKCINCDLVFTVPRKQEDLNT